MAKIEGYQENLPFKAGDTVTIKKGTPIFTITKGSHIAGKNYKVVIHHVLPGQNVPIGTKGHDPSFSVHNPSVVWAGPGGYWSSVDINEVLDASN